MRKQRSDKKTRVAPPLDQSTHNLLQRLALACGMSKTALSEEIIKVALRTEDFVHYLQTKHNAGHYRIITARVDGEIKYIDAGSE